MHIVIVRFSSLGDIILQTPIISWLKFNDPSIEISFVTSREFHSLVDGHPHIDNVFYLERHRGFKDIQNIQKLAHEISKFKDVDLVLDLHNTLRAKLFRLFMWNVPKIIVNKRSFRRWLLIKLKIDTLKNLPSHHYRIINDLASVLNTTPRIAEFKKYLTSLSSFSLTGMTSTPFSFKKGSAPEPWPYIVVSPIASFEAKRWPIAKVNEFLNLFLKEQMHKNLKIVIIAGPKDTYCEDILEDKRIINLQGKTTLKETIEYLAHSQLCFTNDTGSMHIAESFGVKVLSIFGPTVESFGFKPHLEGSKSLSVDLWCRPCSGTGSKKCFRKKQYCMQDISAQMVNTEVCSMLTNGASHV